MGKRIIIDIAGKKIPARLNDTVTAQEFEKLLPFHCQATHHEFDFCAVADRTLPTKASEQTQGWKNGDIGYGGGWFSVLLDGEEQSQSYQMMIIGHMNEEYLDAARAIPGRVDIMVSLAE